VKQYRSINPSPTLSSGHGAKDGAPVQYRSICPSPTLFSGSGPEDEVPALLLDRLAHNAAGTWERMMILKRRKTYPGPGFLAMTCVALVLLANLGGCGPRANFATAGSIKTKRFAADLAVVNARIWTGVDGRDDDGSDQSTGLAVVGGRITVVGDDAAVRAWIGPDTKVIDAQGRRAVPGMTDSHLHLIGGGLQLGRLYLRDVADREEFIRAVADDADSKRKGEWVLGGRFSIESWTEPSEPRKEWIDPVTDDVPVFLTRMDGHQALVNSAALKLAGIDRFGPADPQGGQIIRDPDTGEPTGILKESAMEMVRKHIPQPSADEKYDALKRAMRHANAHGITSVHDMSQLGDLDVYQRAAADGGLTLRIHCYVDVTDWRGYADRIQRYEAPGDMFHVHGFKGFMDGSLGSRTAYMREPYSDADPGALYPRGQLTDFADPPSEFIELAVMAGGRGLQLAVHAIGDEANHILLDAYEATLQRNGPRDARHRIEHAQHLRVEDIPRFSALGVVASMQPLHKADDGRYAEKRVGPERLKGSYAYRQLVDSGALVCFGSDWPVVTLDPFAGIDSAVNARTLAGDVWLASHSLTVQEALRAYTVSPARAVHHEDRIGTLEAGKLADLVILSADPLTEPGEKLGQIRPTHVIVDGKVVFTVSK